MRRVCLGTSNTLRYPQGGHLWVFINWADGFRANGFDVVWLDVVDPKDSDDVLDEKIATLKSRLAAYDLADKIALVTPDGLPVSRSDCISLDEATSSDLLFDLRYDFAESLIKKFRRTALLDIDPGLLQIAMRKGHMNPAPHDFYFTIGESIGGIWEHIPPCVSTRLWKSQPPASAGAYSTVSHWHQNEWMEDVSGAIYKNDKREAFQPFLDLPRRVDVPLELAIHLNNDPAEQSILESHGWRVREAHQVAQTPQMFQKYLQDSRGEFSCAKPAYVKLNTGWISDRTLCYLASGKPAIVQNTGPSRYLDDAAGAVRFSTLQQAADCIAAVEADYESHCAAARELTEKYFCAQKVAARVIEQCIG